jgi:hypothetical protein
MYVYFYLFHCKQNASFLFVINQWVGCFLRRKILILKRFNMVFRIESLKIKRFVKEVPV